MTYKNYLVSYVILMFIALSLEIVMIVENLIIYSTILAILLILFTILFVIVIKKAFTGDFEGNVDHSQVSIEWFEHHRKKNESIYCCYLSEKIPHEKEAKQKPLVIIAHGANGCVELMDWISIPITLHGCNVLLYNQSGHGRPDHKSSGDKGNYVSTISDIHEVLEFIQKEFPYQQYISKDLEGNFNLGFVGHSTGGLIALTQAYLRKEIKITIALSGIHDFMELVHQDGNKFSASWFFKISLRLAGLRIDYSIDENKIISPKYCLTNNLENKDRLFMIHCKDDVLPFSDALLNKELADIPDENLLFLPKGGHGFRGQETIVISKITHWLDRRFSDKFKA